MPVKFQSDTVIIASKFGASRLHEILWSIRLINRGPGAHEATTWINKSMNIAKKIPSTIKQCTSQHCWSSVQCSLYYKYCVGFETASKSTWSEKMSPSQSSTSLHEHPVLQAYMNYLHIRNLNFDDITKIYLAWHSSSSSQLRPSQAILVQV